MGPPAAAEVRELDVRANTLTPWWRVRMSWDRNRLRVAWTETLLGLIPVRRRHLDIHPDAVWLAPRLYPDRLALALACLVSGLVSGGWLRFAFGCAAVLMGALSVILVLHVRSSVGETRIPACVVQRKAIASFLDRRGTA